jgi:hypothetical protein
MNTSERYVEFRPSKSHRPVSAFGALCADAELANRASAMAQLSRRNQRALRELYFAPRVQPDKERAAQGVSSTSDGPRLQWIGELGATAVAVCLVLVVVIVMAMPHMA